MKKEQKEITVALYIGVPPNFKEFSEEYKNNAYAFAKPAIEQHQRAQALSRIFKSEGLRPTRPALYTDEVNGVAMAWAVGARRLRRSMIEKLECFMGLDESGMVLRKVFAEKFPLGEITDTSKSQNPVHNSSLSPEKK